MNAAFSGPPDLPPRRPVTWREALDRLEAHADRAEQMIRGQVPPDEMPWLPPSDLGPIPDEFVPRARHLLERQRQLMSAIPAMLSDNHHQRRVADRVADATIGPAQPVYLDVTA
ncbi:hypothetical protein ASE01_00055 [Nocardioides sp. Root190]|uniref:hypothetical protein n=1 Tax=Nocardioides sp. Root190 TaxID=1736488 RepID=UPI0006F54F92|nr:hypothetical protein [Nocardioides sp. Root190]KRB79946.1 hypothetical protein ASE01_00055 [Nocardioides sp. Root190]